MRHDLRPFCLVSSPKARSLPLEFRATLMLESQQPGAMERTTLLHSKTGPAAAGAGTKENPRLTFPTGSAGLAS
jgi:hypothetical protein